MNIAFTISSGLGDALFFAPTLLALKDIYPKARFYAIAPKFVFNNLILKDILKIEELISLNRPKSLNPKKILSYTVSFNKLVKEIERKKFDIFINTIQARIIDQYILQVASKSPIKICPGYWRGKRNPFRIFANHKIKSEKEHIVQEHFDIARFLSPEEIYIEQSLIKLKDLIKSYSLPIPEYLYSNEIVTIFPGSGSQSYKRWPFARFLEVIKYILKSTNLTVAVAGGNNEYDSKIISEDIQKNGRFYNIGEKFNLRQLINLISKSKFVLSNDNGLLHLAEFLKTNTIGIYPSNWEYVSGKYLYQDVKHIILPELNSDPIVKHLRKKSFRSKNFTKLCRESILAVSVNSVIEKINFLINHE